MHLAPELPESIEKVLHAGTASSPSSKWTLLSIPEKEALFASSEWDIDYFAIHGSATALLENADVDNLLASASGKFFRKCYKQEIRTSKGFWAFGFCKIGDFMLCKPVANQEQKDQEHHGQEQHDYGRERVTIHEDEVQSESSEEDEAYEEPNSNDPLLTVPQQRARLNKILRGSRLRDSHPFREIKSEIERMFGEDEIVLLRFGQKDPSGRALEALSRLRHRFYVDIALAMETTASEYFYAVNSAGCKKSGFFPFLFNKDAGNIIIRDPGLDDVYKLVGYNTSQHSKKHIGFLLSATSSFEDQVKRHLQRHYGQIESVFGNTSLRVEAYVHLKCSLDAVKDVIGAFFKKALKVVKTIAPNVVSYIQVICRALQWVFRSNWPDGFQKQFFLLELYYQYCVALFCLEPQSKAIWQDLSGFGLRAEIVDFPFLQLKENIATSLDVSLLARK
jgi:hypothetical protein